MKTVFALAAGAVLVSASAQAATIYAADFTQPVSIDHTTTGNALEPSPQSGANFTIGYKGTPASDTTRNFFETDGDSLKSSDFGGHHFMRTDPIDVSQWNQVGIDIVNDFVGIDTFNNAPTEFILYEFQLDGGADTPFFLFSDDPNGIDLNATATINVTDVSSLVVGISANVNGASDGWDLSSLTVTGTIATPPIAVIPLPAGLPLLLMGAASFLLVRRRTA